MQGSDGQALATGPTVLANNSQSTDDSHVCLDGSLVTVSSPDAVGEDPWSGGMRCLDGGGRETGFQLGPKGTVDMMVADRPDLTFHETYTFQTGTLRVGSR